MVERLLYDNGRIRLVLEITILYVVLPMMIMLESFAVPLLFILLLMGITVFIYLYHDPAFKRAELINWSQGRKEIKNMAFLFLPAAAGMVLLIWIIDQDRLFYLFRENPVLLLMISFFYPVFSVIPQGLAYRGLFFHRYAVLFPGKWLRIVSSAIAFSFGHVLYKNWWVLLLTFMAGMLFAWRYERSRSLAISIIEHALYGIWLFACGLGYFFVSGFVE